MQFGLITIIISMIIFLVMIGGLAYLFFLLTRLLKKYIKSEPARKEKAQDAKSLGEVLKKYRTECHMTQEFVAESIGVSRQAVSKWESGISAPSTTNLIALGKLFHVAPEILLREIQ